MKIDYEKLYKAVRRQIETDINWAKEWSRRNFTNEFDRGLLRGYDIILNDIIEYYEKQEEFQIKEETG